MLRDQLDPDTNDILFRREIEKRRSIEARHSPHDDGTDLAFLHACGSGHEYDESGEPPDNHDEPARLTEYGLTVKEVNLCEENGCEEIADVRSAVLSGEIPTWINSGSGTERKIRRALERVDEANRGVSIE